VGLRGDEQQCFSTASVLLSAAFLSSGLPGLAAAGDLLTCCFVAALCVCMWVCALEVKQLLPTLTCCSMPDMLQQMALLFALNSVAVVEQPAFLYN